MQSVVKTKLKTTGKCKFLLSRYLIINLQVIWCRFSSDIPVHVISVNEPFSFKMD